MFSALKLGWLLDQVDPDRAGCRSGRMAVGTVDAWLLFSLTGEHRIEMGNASRTQLLNLERAEWDAGLAERLGIPEQALPEVVASDQVSGPLKALSSLARETRIYAVLGDSHAALYANGAREPGRAKATYGTGSSVIALSGTAPAPGNGGLVQTIAWSTGSPEYAHEGTILSTGSRLIWLPELFGTDPYGLSRLAVSAPPELGRGPRARLLRTRCSLLGSSGHGHRQWLRAGNQTRPRWPGPRVDLLPMS
ncbi:glycerol kinase [Pseudarthrobacter enclensis]|uniref:Glycerol kinase n=2 Tax=Pseudarthrobacter enclensis TaxID=993070 RepID=A0ABT9RZR1_9MICC|nr:glycerol kinase [Pseudarthrobacter enclensis]